MRRRSTTRLLTAFALLLPAYARADEPIALSGSTRDVVASAAATEPSSGDVVDEDASEHDDDEARHGRRRHGPNRDRRVPEPHGAAYERAQALGLGTRDAAVALLHEQPRRAWVAAAGRARVRDLRWPVDEGGFGRGVGYVRTDRPDVPHNGVDIVAPRGSVIRAAADGIVAYSDNGLRGYGNCVIIVHTNGWITLYGHADRTTVQAGWRVRRGERIGFVGSTGHSQGPHLHFELRVDGRPVDPLPHFPGQPWISGRNRLNALRARPDGGHSREHLGAIAPDFDAAPDPRPARVDTAAERAEARRVAARIARSERDVPRMHGRLETRTEGGEPTAPSTRAHVQPRGETRPAPQREARPAPQREARLAPQPEARPVRQPEARPAPAPAPRVVAAPTPAIGPDGYPLAPPASVLAMITQGPPVGMLAEIEGRTFETLLFPLRAGEIVRYRGSKLAMRAEPGSAVRAASDGRVVYVGRGIDGDALSVVIVHRNGHVTVYSGFERVMVDEGTSILRGAWIGPARASGETTFALRVRGRAVDPRDRFVLAPGTETHASLAR